MVTVPGFHRRETVRVAGREGFGHRASGFSIDIPSPTQCKLQCGSLRKCLKRW